MEINNYNLLLILAITFFNVFSVVTPDATANITESEFDQSSNDYPSDSYYYDQYNINGGEVTFDQANNQYNTNENTIINNNNSNTNVIEVVKQIETNINEFNTEDEQIESKNVDSNINNNLQDHSNEDDILTTAILGSSEETGDVSDVFMINADSEQQDYPLDSENSVSLLNKLASKSTTPAIFIEQLPAQLDDSKTSQKTQTISQMNSSRNYMTFLFIFVLIVIVAVGLGIVTVLFVKRRSLLLKSKCQIVSGKGQQSYTTVGQTDY